MKQKMLSFLLITIMLFGCIGVSAEEYYRTITKDITVSYNGELLDFGEAVPQVVEGRTMVPLRGIFEKVGCSVDFDADTQTIAVGGKDMKITLQVGSDSAQVEQNGVSENQALDVVPFISEGRTLVPVRFLAENLGLIVNWNGNFREVVLIDLNAWKELIKTNSTLFDQMLSRPLMINQKLLSETAASINYMVKADKLKDANGNILPKIDFGLNISINEASKYDGKASQSKSVYKTDLASLSKFLQAMATEKDDKQLNEILKHFKAYEIDLDIIIDQEWNVYLKSKGIMQILNDCGLKEYADLIGDKYVKISLSEILTSVLGDQYQSELKNMTGWDLIEKFIKADPYLYSESVKVFDSIMVMYSEFFSNELMTQKTEKDGTQTLTYQMDKDDMKGYMNQVFDVFGLVQTMSEPQQEEFNNIMDKIDCNVTFAMKIKDDLVTAMEMKYQYDINSMEVGDGTISLTMSMDMNYTTKNFDKTEKDVVIPTDYFELTELLGNIFQAPEGLN